MFIINILKIRNAPYKIKFAIQSVKAKIFESEIIKRNFRGIRQFKRDKKEMLSQGKVAERYKVFILK